MNTRLLGSVTLLTSPALLVEVYRHGLQAVPNEDTDPTGMVLYALFAVGWLCGMLGLRHLGATGRGRLGRLVITLPLFTIPLALGQSLMDALRVPTDHPLYLVTDLAWPLSMVLTFAVSLAVLFARGLRGWHRAVPLLCGISLPLGLLTMALTGRELSGAAFGWHTFVGWALLGYVVLAARPAPVQPVPGEGGEVALVP